MNMMVADLWLRLLSVIIFVSFGLSCDSVGNKDKGEVGSSQIVSP